MTTTTKITATATASNGKQFQRTTKISRFKFAAIHFHTYDKKFYAKFCETEVQAIEWNNLHKRLGLRESFEIVPVTNK